MSFDGWKKPEQNWSRLPHQFIENLPTFTSKSELCVVLYVMRHTWGYDDDYKRISLDEFKNGRKKKDGTRIDNGTGMSINAIKSGIEQAVKHGFLTVGRDESDKARIKQYYSLSELDYQKLIPGVSEVDTQPSEVDTRTKKETIRNKNIERKDSVPNGTMSPPLPENPKPPKSKPKSKPESDDTVVTEMLAAWGRLFPDKPQPRPTTYRSKIQTQLKMPQFREGWLEAMEWAANSPTCQNESWFHFGFFVQQTKGEYGWEKCLRHWMEWKDKKIRANGNGRTDCVNDVWQSIKIALGKPGKPDISDRALQAVGMVPGGWRRFKEQDVRFIDQLKPIFEEAYERTKQQQPATA